MPNLFENIPPALTEELFTPLLQSGEIMLERIVSQGQTAPAQGWFEQEKDEWVMVLQGAAQLEWEDGQRCDLKPGDWRWIPAGCKHRVSWTDPAQQTVWLALHMPPEPK
ncbi:cupin domain-containing protein [Massilia sp. W12]|uniref:cupin domain-containing protein n=1 Tax=Massilia sp. W12 TaxID=3126507 RepID=UPI0030CF1B8B